MFLLVISRLIHARRRQNEIDQEMAGKCLVRVLVVTSLNVLQSFLPVWISSRTSAASRPFSAHLAHLDQYNMHGFYNEGGAVALRVQSHGLHTQT